MNKEIVKSVAKLGFLKVYGFAPSEKNIVILESSADNDKIIVNVIGEYDILLENAPERKYCIEREHSFKWNGERMEHVMNYQIEKL